MKQKRKRVLCINADLSFLDQQEMNLKNKEIEQYFFGFSDFWDALQFVEKQIIVQDIKIHYILLDEQIISEQLDVSLEKISGLNNFLKRPEIIVCASNNSNKLRNQVMQHPFVSALIVKPIPQNYVEFLITGKSA